MTAHIAVSQTIAAFALHVLWQAPLLACAAALAVRIGRPQARVACALWTATLLLCVLVPFSATATARRAALQAQRDAAVTVTYTSGDDSRTLPQMQRTPAWQRMLQRHLSLRGGLHPFAVALPAAVARTVAGVYGLLALCLGLRLLVAWRRSGRLITTSTALPANAAVVQALHQRCSALGLTAPPVRTSGEVTGPALAGVLRPTLLLPPYAEHMTSIEIRAVLAHELAHLRRHDPPVHLACSLLLVLVGFHPAALLVARRIRQTREMACDAEAAAHMGSPARYAHALLQVAERTGAGAAEVAGRGLFQSGVGLFTTGLGLFPNSLELSGGAMEERMQMMMNGNQSSSTAGRAARWSACAAVGGVALLAATMLQVQPAFAQQQQAIMLSDQTSPTTRVVEQQDDQPRLVGGPHAQQQLRKARRDLDAAARNATTAEERNRIELARAVIGGAQQQLDAADGQRVPHDVDVDAFTNLKIDPHVRIMIDNLKLDPRVRVQIEQQQHAADKIRAEVEAHRADFDRIRIETQSPAFQAKIRAQVDAARSQKPATPIDQAQVQRMLRDALQQREQAMILLRSGERQRQIAQANSSVARMEPLDVPSNSAMRLPDPPANPAVQDKRIKIEGRVMAANVLTKAQPVYPQDAKDAKISGEVLLHVLIDETGKVESLQVISSPDKSLSTSAIAAVQQWTYKPYLLNGTPTAVETTVTVQYSFGS